MRAADAAARAKLKATVAEALSEAMQDMEVDSGDRGERTVQAGAYTRALSRST